MGGAAWISPMTSAIADSTRTAGGGTLSLHAAGFFMPRGIRWFGWGVVLAGLFLLGAMVWTDFSAWNVSPHVVMGVIFGASHLAYGIYLYFTEQRKNET